MKKEENGFIDFLKGIPDHRIERRKLYPVEEILLIVFCGMVCGCDSWDDFETFGKAKLEYLKKYFPYKNGTPSDDTFRRFFRVLDPQVFEECFTNWVRSFQIDLKDKIIAIDGKTCRCSFDGENGRPLHLISAFVSEIGISLGQLKTEEKSNEITAIPQLLEVLDIKDSTITLDAMGCQIQIVKKIIEKEAEYVIALKGNQGTLHEDVRTVFEKEPNGCTFSEHHEDNKGHGRKEYRKCTVGSKIDWLKKRHQEWTRLESIIKIESRREVKGKIETESRYYISSLRSSPKALLHAVRKHWEIENKLHWILDVVFNDDQSRIRKGNAPRNIAIVKKTVLNLLQITKKEKDLKRMSLKLMRKMSGWDHDFLDHIIMTRF
jgi:predicted transposase YbfD/YdcC